MIVYNCKKFHIRHLSPDLSTCPVFFISMTTVCCRHGQRNWSTYGGFSNTIHMYLDKLGFEITTPKHGSGHNYLTVPFKHTGTRIYLESGVFNSQQASSVSSLYSRPVSVTELCSLVCCWRRHEVLAT